MAEMRMPIRPSNSFPASQEAAEVSAAAVLIIAEGATCLATTLVNSRRSPMLFARAAQKVESMILLRRLPEGGSVKPRKLAGIDNGYRQPWCDEQPLWDKMCSRKGINGGFLLLIPGTRRLIAPP